MLFLISFANNRQPSGLPDHSILLRPHDADEISSVSSMDNRPGQSFPYQH